MSEKVILEGQYSNALTYPDTLTGDWGPNWLSLDPETPEIPEENEICEPEVVTITTPEVATVDTFPQFPDEAEAENEFYWSQLLDHDREYLTWHRDYPAACEWCGGRTRHNPLCDELRASWQPTMPFGLHKGKPLSAVPLDYLQWLTENSDSLDSDLRDAIQERLSEKLVDRNNYLV